ncbi:MAG: hypothetical protein AMS21_00190 [Gemmatimonas sp. SG8_38_2]|nr:MAG: hypothetical protein AMS21_00190 [Gemmatimonas sp. SG8_38_2]
MHDAALPLGLRVLSRHQSPDGASRDPDAFTKELVPHLLDAVDAAEALLVHAPNLRAQRLIALR